MAGPDISLVRSWTCEEVGQWLETIGFQKYVDLLSAVHQIDGSVLLSLSESDLRQPPLQLEVLGDIKRLGARIEEIRHGESKKKHANNSLVSASGSDLEVRGRDAARNRKGKAQFSQESLESDDQDSFCDFDNISKDIPPEIWKTALSFVYLFTVFLITAFVMVVVHDRVPEMDKYPPLPDLFLDNMPHVPWAFDVCEMVGIILCLIWCTILVFHKHRFIIMRRMFSLMGTIFLLRCVTMLITSLSVPGRHLRCSGKTYGTLYAKIERTLEIWRGLGMSLHGVRTCGDYMFSGHTSIITQLNFFITEYTPRKFYYLHIVSWCLNFFGIFFLLAAHEHYSIDVFMAFYLNSRLFMYYHTLANNRALMQQDANRTRVWFPLFSFFESKCHGRVPNEFESPLTVISNVVNRVKSLVVSIKPTSSCGTDDEVVSAVVKSQRRRKHN